MHKKVPIYRSQHWTRQGLELVTNPLDTLMEGVERYGDFFHVPFFHRKIYATTNLEAIRHVLQVNHKNYVKSPAYRELKRALGEGLVTSEGDHWKRQRRLSQPAFYKSQLNLLFQKMTDTAVQYCDELQQKCTQKESFDLLPEMMKVTADLVLKALFSTFQQQDKEEMAADMNFAQDHIMRRTINPLAIPFGYIDGRERRFQQSVKRFDEKIHQMIEDRRSAKNPPVDLLTMLVQAQDADDGNGMTEKQLRDEAITIYSAGHETTANAMTWTLYRLCREPEIVQKMRAEIAAVVGDQVPSFEDLMKLQYVRQVIEEGMRLYPPAYAVGRESIDEDQILDYKIPKKSIILIGIYALHRDPQYYPNPDKFDPTRFESTQVSQRPKLAYLPFGAGPRMCIGNHFAMMEMQLLLTLLIRRFDFVWDDRVPVVKNALITMKPKDGVFVWVKEC